jgi:hypothetical protein
VAAPDRPCRCGHHKFRDTIEFVLISFIVVTVVVRSDLGVGNAIKPDEVS